MFILQHYDQWYNIATNGAMEKHQRYWLRKEGGKREEEEEEEKEGKEEKEEEEEEEGDGKEE